MTTLNDFRIKGTKFKNSQSYIKCTYGCQSFYAHNWFNGQARICPYCKRKFTITIEE